MALLVHLTPFFLLSWGRGGEEGKREGGGWGFGLGHFVDLFSVRVGKYISYLVEKKKPKAVVVCMIYYPCKLRKEGEEEGGAGGWADGVLGALKYENFPEKLQTTIDVIYEKGTKQVKIPGYNCKEEIGGWGGWWRGWWRREEEEEKGVVVPVALSDALDWRKGSHYDKRVEPSVLGGKRMAQHFLNVLFPELARPLPDEA